MPPPEVSIIVPCYNEARTIRLLLEALAVQTHPLESLEVLIADGMSTDGTREAIAAFQAAVPALRVRVVDNPARIIPAALNRAIEAATGVFIVRLDAHSRPAPDYVQRCVEALKEGRGDNVGGIWEIVPGGPGWQARSIAAAAGHPLGAGDAHYRHTGRAQHVDTVPFGAFRRDLVERIGSFDETLLTNEDYEFNVRIRRAGGRIWLDPAIRTTYFARATFADLARQYLRYGYWKGRMLKRYPDTLRWRQLLPPLFVLGLLLGAGAALVLPVVRPLYLAALFLYAFILLVGGGVEAVKRRDPALVVGFPLAVAVMHICWGGALLWSRISRR